MGKYRMVYVDFWNDPVVIEEMTPEDRYFYLYLLTNAFTTQIGIYKITKKLMACDLGYSIESVHSLLDRFINHHKLIRYNTETRELAIRDWGKDNLRNVGKPVINCIVSELREVEDTSLISYVAEHIGHGPIQDIYETFCIKEETAFLPENKAICSDYNTYINPVIPSADDSYNDTSTTRNTIRGQKEKEEEKEKEKEKQQQQKDLYPSIEENLESVHTNKEYANDIIAFWDKNGFGNTNVNTKQQL
ncbi:DNA replication protein DnaD [Fredinandcohnia sp. 179-A 10B2 NHS]|uniref:DNA replication protein DnaD n=1 Tax=Fredinandcohnia sp. 179-A 10B2 NHS TaxID=3235176 RepID=UPI0039A22977